ncbi:MAG: HEAT repeat domain-containing protein, partial [Myxococcales bacterium]|nr:HEAT repeat domain-containing protein [Myxococcales bacterium]
MMALGLRRSRRRRGAVAVGLGGLLLAASSARAEPKRWPTWPTEIHRISASLIRDVRGNELTGERQRVAAIQELDRFATGAILEPLLHALDDASPQVRREALRMCFEREVVACIPGAANLWAEGGEPTVRVAALKVLALDPEPSRAALLIDALRDPSEVIRAQAADFLGSAPLEPSVRQRARTALLAKLADVSVVVRRRAVLSLGLLGPGEGTLSIARLLEDPEPTVRAAAAEALGHYRDATAVPALRRAIADPNEATVARAIIDALAVLPDPEVEPDLLRLLDDPPAGLDEYQLAAAIARRPAPSATLLEGLVDRLDEPERSDAVLQALLAMGEDARGVLEQARARGLAPPLEVEVERLLDAIAPEPPPARPRRFPALDDRAGWRDRIERGDAFARRRAAAALARRDPPWRRAAALAVIARPGPLAGREPWVLALAAGPDTWEASGAEP